MQKTPAVAYFDHKIKTTPRRKMYEQIEDAPLKKIDRHFLYDVIEGLSYKELSEKYNKSESRIYQWKRQLYELLSKYDYQHLS